MPGLTLSDKRAYLKKSLSSVNANKINGLLAEIELRDYLVNLDLVDGSRLVDGSSAVPGRHLVKRPLLSSLILSHQKSISHWIPRK